MEVCHTSAFFVLLMPRWALVRCDHCRKSKEQSDSMKEAFEAVSLPWLFRRAVGFLNYLEVPVPPVGKGSEVLKLTQDHRQPD